MESPYWLTGEVLAYFRITRSTLQRWRKSQGFPEPVHFRVDGRDPAYYAITECISWDEKRRSKRTNRLPASSETEAHFGREV
jgi:hypothetical protein